MRRLVAFGAPVLLALTACTAIVAGQLSPYDDYSKDGGISQRQADQCSIIPDNDASPECANCIIDGCKDELDYACSTTTTPKEWFTSIKNCAEAPYRDFSPIPSQYSWNCGTFDDPDAAKIEGDDPAAHKQNSKVCVYQNCLTGDAPPCKLCPVSIVEEGTTYTLDDSTCGKCMQASCGAEIIRCCQTEVVQYNLAYCSDPRPIAASSGGDTNDVRCRGMVELEAGAPTSTNPNETCAISIPKCARDHCLSACSSF